ncbi:hypothetical protein GQ457_11G013470 [Hibiscus cannabinus]
MVNLDRILTKDRLLHMELEVDTRFLRFRERRRSSGKQKGKERERDILSSLINIYSKTLFFHTPIKNSKPKTKKPFSPWKTQSFVVLPASKLSYFQRYVLELYVGGKVFDLKIDDFCGFDLYLKLATGFFSFFAFSDSVVVEGFAVKIVC